MRTPPQLLAEIAALRGRIAELRRRPRPAPADEADVPSRLLVDALADALLAIDEESTIVLANPAAARLFGYEGESLVGRPLTLLMPEALRPVHRAGVRGYLASGVRNFPWAAIELPGLHRSGERLPLSIALGECVHDDRRLFVATLRDVSAERRLHDLAAGVAETAAALAGLTEPPEVAERAATAAATLLRASAAVTYAFDADTGALTPMAWTGGQPPTDTLAEVAGQAIAGGRARWRDGVLALPLVAGEHALGALAVARADEPLPGEVERAEALARAVAGALQAVRRLASSERRRRSAERLAEAGRWLSLAHDVGAVARRTADAAVALLDARGAVVFRLEAPGEPLPVAVVGHGEGRARDLAVAVAAEAARLAVAGRGPVATPDVRLDLRLALSGERRVELAALDRRALLAVPLGAGDTAVGACCVADRAGRTFGDDEVRALAALAAQAAGALEAAAAHDEMRAALATVERSQRWVVDSERLHAVADLASGVSHHLNNLLMVILARVQLLLPGVDDAEVRHALERIERTALDGADVIRRLHAFAEVQSVAVAVPVDLAALARDAVALLRPRWDDDAGTRGVHVEAVLEAGAVPTVPGDPVALREVIVALLANATDAMPAGGRVTVHTWATEEGVHCAVADSGTGMEEAVRRRALEPFFTTKGAQSLGLGLSVAHGIVRRHGGDLEIAAGETGGTVVTLRLPRALGAAAGPALEEAG
jgi:PAS domain S-box-containing protein